MTALSTELLINILRATLEDIQDSTPDVPGVQELKRQLLRTIAELEQSIRAGSE